MMVVVLIRILTVRLWLPAVFALAINSATGCRQFFKNQIVQNLRVFGNLEADRASLHMTVLNLPQ